MNATTTERLEYLRGEIRAERISYGELHELQTLAEQGHIDPSDTELLEAAGVPEQSEPKAPAKPLWQLDIRQRLALSPDRTDPISRLLFAALYAAEDEAEFLNLVENHVEELRRAIDATKAGAK